MRFNDFVTHPQSVRANLHPAHVLALRLYSTAAFVQINEPLRRLSSEGNRCAHPHPFPNTVHFLSAGIKQLRTNSAPAPGEVQQVQYLYRGLRDVCVSHDFLQRGGSELAIMSATTSLEVALRYATSESSESPMLLRLRLRSFLQCGADISFCSTFPAEHEVIYPPQTFIKPDREPRIIENITVIDADIAIT